MGKVTRKRYSGEFKSRVALEAIRGEQTLAELASKHGVHQTMVALWKRQAIEGMAATFYGKQAPEAAASPADVEKLHAKIGQLLVERDHLPPPCDWACSEAANNRPETASSVGGTAMRAAAVEPVWRLLPAHAGK